jgi:hypothetical protein
LTGPVISCTFPRYSDAYMPMDDVDRDGDDARGSYLSLPLRQGQWRSSH